MFLIGAFLTGGAVGFAADRAMTRAGPDAKSTDERVASDSLAHELNLTADQRQLFDSVFDWRRARYREIMKIYRPILDSARDSARVLMRASLDSAQQVRFNALIERNNRAADSITRVRETRQ